MDGTNYKIKGASLKVLPFDYHNKNLYNKEFMKA